MSAVSRDILLTLRKSETIRRHWVTNFRRAWTRPPLQAAPCTAQEFDPVNVLTSRQMLKLPAESPQIPRPNQAIHRRGGGERESEAESTPATR